MPDPRHSRLTAEMFVEMHDDEEDQASPVQSLKYLMLMT